MDASALSLVREHLHQLLVRSRLPQQQAEHVHPLAATRLVAEQFEQQRQRNPYR